MSDRTPYGEPNYTEETVSTRYQPTSLHVYLRTQSEAKNKEQRGDIQLGPYLTVAQSAKRNWTFDGNLEEGEESQKAPVQTIRSSVCTIL